jgi:aldehyde:ferredoxin oxidoreductase
MFDRILRIDLKEQTAKKDKISKKILEKFIGGKGVGMRLLTEEDTSKDPFDPENPLIFVTGPLTGSLIQTSGRSALVTRSPLTNTFLDSHAGGHFGPALKRSGWDYLLIKGASEKPVYLHISPDDVRFEKADTLWGADAFETEKILWKKHPKSKVACIGPAGENLVRFASIGTELFRHFGRGGAGAVMGSKKLKAVTVNGDATIKMAKPEKLADLAIKLTTDLKEHPNAKKRKELGTMMWIRMGQEIGKFLPTKNFQKGQFEHYENITAESMKEKLKWTSKGCYGCGVIMCSKVSHWNGKEMEGPEYETTAYLGSGCMLEDPEEVVEANWLCDKYGLDTISTGVTISYAMESAEKEVLSPEENVRIKFGSSESVYELIEKIAYREGIGDILAEGTRKASKIIGGGSDYWAIQTAGMELSGVNPLGSYSMALALVTSDFASHTRLWTATSEMNQDLVLEELPQLIVDGQDEINARNSLIVCDFLPYGLDRLVPFLNAATGLDYTEEDLLIAGSRMQSLSRMYNMKKGRSHKDDTLPKRFFEEESIAGLMKGKKIPKRYFMNQVQEVFKIRGWDTEGFPTEENLEKLGLNRI